MTSEPEPPHLSDESSWYTEHTALLIATTKWALLGAVAGVCVGAGTRGFLWALQASGHLTARVLGDRLQPYWFLPLALPGCVWLIRSFAPAAKGHGTEAVIAAVHKVSGRIEWKERGSGAACDAARPSRACCARWPAGTRACRAVG